ncbi:MAG: S41 family peptidase [Clostridia bacterium]|nr:S41 family peptidase [Clostridia bacterium]
MYKKRHLVITAILTAVLVFLTTSFVHLKREFESINKVSRARDMIQEYYVDRLTKEQIDKMDDAAISAMVKSLNDPYSSYLNAEDFKDYKENNEEEYIGIGISVTFTPKDNTLIVMSPYDNSPAQKAGIIPGDRILSVNGVEVTADTYDDIIDAIKDADAPEGEELNLRIERGAQKKIYDISLKREKIAIQTVSSKMFASGIGYIRISQFMNSTEQDFKAALDNLCADGMKGLVIDLRNNPGGYAHTVISMADMLLPEGTIAYLEDNKGRKEYFKSDKNELGLPMVVLINGGTASAAELMAGSIQAYDLGVLVGEKSFGKAVGQSPLPLTKSSAIYLTNARYYTPKGECIDKKGIEPDVKVELPTELYSRLTLLTLSEDVQLSKAIELMKEKVGA